jgi:hypothetical protein
MRDQRQLLLPEPENLTPKKASVSVIQLEGHSWMEPESKREEIELLRRSPVTKIRIRLKLGT